MKPTPGKTYTTLKNDTLNRIASLAYGSQQNVQRLKSVNNSQLRLTDSEIIPEGTKIIIPQIPAPAEIRNKQFQKGLGK